MVLLQHRNQEMQRARLCIVRAKACNMASQKKYTDAERRADSGAVVRAERSLMLKRDFYTKGERALPAQSGGLEHRAEIRAVRCAVFRADTHAELRAVIRAELCVEKNSTDAEICAESDADAGAEIRLIVAKRHNGIINV